MILSDTGPNFYHIAGERGEIHTGPKSICI